MVGPSASCATRGAVPLASVASMTRRLVPIAMLLALAVPAGATAKSKPKSQFYVNVGDSYATGYQPAADGSAGTGTTDGYADQLVPLAKARGYTLKLRNFGCGGATTASLLKQKGCPKRARAVANAVTYKGTQADAVVTFLKAHRKQTGLITVSISGNDVTKCAKAANAVTCVGEASASIKKNLKTLLTRFRKAAGKKVRVVGTTYPDVILGEWAKGTESGQSLARLSQIAFKSIINPALKEQYEGAGGKFVDVTAATGGYDSLDGPTTTVPGQQPYSILPVPVARICELTWYCRFGDIHSKRSGYRVIAKLIAGTLPKK